MSLRLPAVDADWTVQQAFDEIAREWPVQRDYRGTGDPNGVVTAGPGARYVNLVDGLTWFHDDPAISDTNWNVK